MRLIDAVKFEELFYKQIELGANGFEAAEDALQDTPTVDAVPVRRGSWIKSQGVMVRGHLLFTDGVRCSECGNGHSGAAYCEECGAKMEDD